MPGENDRDRDRHRASNDEGTSSQDLRLLRRLLRLAQALEDDDFERPDRTNRARRRGPTRQSPSSIGVGRDQPVDTVQYDSDRSYNTDDGDDDESTNVDERQDDDFDIDGDDEECPEEHDGEEDNDYDDEMGDHTVCNDERRARARSSTTKPKRSHSAVEKKYRSTLNGKIQQLHALIPPSGTWERTTNAGEATGGGNGARGSGDGNEAPSKPVVLDTANRYVLHLERTYTNYEAEEEQLRQRLHRWLDA